MTVSKISILSRDRSWLSVVKCALFTLLALCRGAKAQQQILISPPEIVTTPPAMQAAVTEGSETAPASPPASDLSRLQALFRFGPLTLRPHAFYSAIYGDGIQASPGQQFNTVIQTVSPGLLFQIGSHCTLDYSPAWTYYSDRHFRDTLDHSVRFNLGAAYEDWVMGLSQTYITSSTPLVETGVQTDQETYGTALTASYRFNSKIAVDLALSQEFVSAQKFTSYREWSTLDWFNYQLEPRLDVALGAGFDYVNEDGGSDMTSEQMQGRIRWRAVDVVGLQLHAGLEDRQFVNSGAPDLLNPVFGASFVYQPKDFTTLSLNVDRIVDASYFDNQTSETTTLNASLDQRLLKHLRLGLSGGYSKISYVASAAGIAARPDTDYYFINARLSCAILKRGTVALTYQYSDNRSAQPGFTYSTSQVGIEIGYQY